MTTHGPAPARSRDGMVATSQVAAVDAGIAILERGGTAADAAIAAAAALAVTEPCSNGLGGDCFALHYEAASQEVTALNGSGRAAAALTLERARADAGGGELPPFHAHTVTVPGAVRGWHDLHERHGRLPMAALLEPAIRLAADGFEVGEVTSHFWALGAAHQLRHQPHGAELLAAGGRAPAAGERFANLTLARTLEEIAGGGADAFYRGRPGRAIAGAVAAAGGLLDAGDLAAHASTWDEPISAVYRGHRIVECPPSGQGLVALLALATLEALGPAAPPATTDRIHRTVEALRLAFADGLRHIADPAFAAIPVQALLDPAHAAARARAVDPARARPRPPPVDVAPGNDTVYLTVVSGAGDACSFIQSNYMGFGTGIVPEGCGFTLQNRGHGFSLDPTHPNALAPRKRPYHTIIPALVLRADRSLHASFGVMGGFMQPQGHVQVVQALLDDQLDPQAALDRPRFYLEPRPGRTDDVALEEGISGAVARELEARGHRIRSVGGIERALFGRGQVILRDPCGDLIGGSDPRADGCAKGL